MDSHIKKFFFGKNAHFHHVISLNDSPDLSWEEVSEKCPTLCRGWFELSKLKRADRIEFTRDFWLSKIPYQPEMLEAFLQFFNSLDDIVLFLAQKEANDPYECYMVYSLNNNRGFFHGKCPSREEEIVGLQQLFPEVILPQDYLLFLSIHNGFAKAYDTGVLNTKQIAECTKRFRQGLSQEEPLLNANDQNIDPETLIPFYESYEMPVYQCFWSEWYPEQEMGNVYYSGLTRTISDIRNLATGEENLAFPTFIDWLLFYLEKVD